MSEETKTMTREEVMAHEHKIQTGETDVLLDGRTTEQTWEDNLRLQKEQEEALRERGVKWAEKRDAKAAKTGDDFLSEKVEVRVADNGVTSARPVIESEIAAPSGSNPLQPESDLPQDFPAREALAAAGVNLALVKTMSDEHLLAIKDIGKASLEKIRAYFTA